MPVTFTAATWLPASDGATGTLHFEIDQVEGRAAAAAAAGGQLTLRVELAGATFAGTDQPDDCQPAGATVTCSFPQPDDGPAAFNLLVTGLAPDATATAQVLRDGETEATLAGPLRLAGYASGVGVTRPTWTSHGGGTGTLSTTLTQSESWQVEGVRVSVDLTGGAVPGEPLPEGCQPVTHGGEGGVTCSLTLEPGEPHTLDLPVTVTGQGQKATLVVRVGDDQVGETIEVELPAA